ncbi:MAG TPA: RHS repeat-associated core domain-containing protein [Pelobium sp.]
MGCLKLHNDYFSELDKSGFKNCLASKKTKNKGHSSYDYGFNGMERDDAVKGRGNSYNYKKRMYDPRVGRFLSIDPKASSFPWYTPYQFAGNTPIMAIDLDGLEPAYFATRRSNGTTKLTLAVIGMFAELYGQQYWMAGAEANLQINQKIHDKITHYKSGAITLGFEINYTNNYRNASGTAWLNITSHEIVHVEQFRSLFGDHFKNNQKYKEAKANWMILYGMEAGSTWIKGKLNHKSSMSTHDEIPLEKEANAKQTLFMDFFNSQYYKKKSGGIGNKVIDLLKKAHQAMKSGNKDAYHSAYNTLIDLVRKFKSENSKKENNKNKAQQ